MGQEQRRGKGGQLPPDLSAAAGVWGAAQLAQSRGRELNTQTVREKGKGGGGTWCHYSQPVVGSAWQVELRCSRLGLQRCDWPLRHRDRE